MALVTPALDDGLEQFLISPFGAPFFFHWVHGLVLWLEEENLLDCD
jgi:hypothetical protein